MSALRLSTDRKVTNAVTKGGNPVIPNAFGLPAGNLFSCPGMTDFCGKVCYAKRNENQYKNVSKLVMNNWWAVLYADYLGLNALVDLIDDMVTAFSRECTRRNLPKAFRIHWDGDFFSEQYAKAWGIVCRAHKDIQFWVYTRSFTDEINVLPHIVGIDNLTVYLSADPVNIAKANERAEQYPGVFIATVADTFAEARETISLDRKTYPCPENGKRLPLISEKGSACMQCGVCVVGRGDVLFSATKR